MAKLTTRLAAMERASKGTDAEVPAGKGVRPAGRGTHPAPTAEK